MPANSLKSSSYEYPPKSGIKISLLLNQTEGKIYGDSYRVYIPARLSGKSPVQKQFKSEAEAKSFAKDYHYTVVRHGQGAAELSTREIIDAQEAIAKLTDAGIKLTLAGVTDYTISKLSTKRAGTLSQIIDFVYDLKERKGLRERTLNTYKSRWGILLEQIGDLPATKLDAKTLEDFLVNISTDGRTVYNYYTDINNLLSIAVDEGFISDNPLDNLTKSRKDALFQTASKSEKPPPEIYTVEEAEKLLSICLYSNNSKCLEWLPCLVLGLFCGLRTTEIRKLKWSDVLLRRESPFVSISERIAKGRFVRNVSIPQNALLWLNKCDQSNEDIFLHKGSNPYDHRRTLVHNLAGIKTKENGARHSYGSYYLELTKNIPETCLNMGHSNGDQMLFRHYRRLIDDGDGSRFFNIKPSRM